MYYMASVKESSNPHEFVLPYYDQEAKKRIMEPSTPSLEPRSQSQLLRTPPTTVRLWKPTAQRNLRNQWSKLNSLRHDWRAVSATARSHATSLVNSYLSQKYMDTMDFCVLNDMPNIRTKACRKLFKQQELYRGKLLSTFRDMVATAVNMVTACKSTRCYFKGTSSNPLAQFSFFSEDDNSDSGDCGGIPVFTFLSVSSFEEMAWEVTRMVLSELSLKRLLVMELLSICDEKVVEVTRLHWSDEFYEREFVDLGKCSLYSKETGLVLPSLFKCNATDIKYKQEPESDVLQVYLTTWLTEVSIDKSRMDEIFDVVGEEMHVDFLQTSA